MMKKTITYLLAWRALFLVLATLTACNKDTNFDSVKPTISQSVSPTGTMATFSACAEYVGKFDMMVEWSKNENMASVQSLAMNAEGSGNYSATITGLTKLTTYYYRVTLSNSFMKKSTSVESFTTLDSSVPEVTTIEVTSVGTTTATGSGNVTNDGGNVVTERGICWSTSHNPTLNEDHKANGTGTGTYVVKLIGLAPSTKYYMCAYAVNSEGIAYGDEVSFTTNSLSIPAVTTSQATEVGYDKASVGGMVTDDGGATVTERGVYWGTSNPPTTKMVMGSGLGDFDGQLTGLSENTQYYYVAYAVNSMGENKGELKEFITTSIPTYSISVSANPSNGGTVTGGGTYNQGNQCTVTATSNSGFIFTNWTENDSVVSTQTNYTFTVTNNRSLVAIFTAIPTGAINGVFSVSSSKKVYFSQGNLQYRASTNTWRFAENQWDFVGTQTPDQDGYYGGTVQGSDNKNISSTYENYIDLFGWGTSGWNNGAVCYQPWSISNVGSDYYPGGSYTNNLTGSYANADWGVYNKIYNGGNTAGQWRTLTNAEWIYVFQDRSDASSKYGHGKVNDVCGIILLPDSWTLPSGLSFTSGNSSWTNNYTREQWAQMEANGAVFFPAAGYRYSTLVYSVGARGYYWSTTYYDSRDAYRMYFQSGSHLPSHNHPRINGMSVRLVAPAE